MVLRPPLARVSAATSEIFPSNADAKCDEEFENVAHALKPVDVLIFHGRTYTQTCRRVNHLIEGNYIHQMWATSGGGNDVIQVKVASYGNIRENPEGSLATLRRVAIESLAWLYYRVVGYL